MVQGIVSVLDEECDWTVKTGPRGLVDVQHIGLFYPLAEFKNTNHLSDEFRDWNSPKAQALANQIIQTVDYYEGTRKLDIQTGEVGIRIVDATKITYANGKTFRRLHLKSIETELGRVNPPLEEEEDEDAYSELDEQEAPNSMASSQVSQLGQDNDDDQQHMGFHYPQNSFAGSMNVPSMPYAPPPGQVPGNLPPNSSYMQATGMYPSAVHPLAGRGNFPREPARMVFPPSANSINSAYTGQEGSDVLRFSSAGTNWMPGAQYPGHPYGKHRPLRYYWTSLDVILVMKTIDSMQMSYGPGHQRTSEDQYLSLIHI